MTSENNDINRKKQQDVEAKENEIDETLNTVSYKTIKDSKKEASIIGDSEVNK